MNMYIVSWVGESRVMVAASMDALWKRIRHNYTKGCVVTIEDADTRRTYTK